MSLGHNNLVYYVDNGASGRNLDRPGFCQMEADIQTGRIQSVLVSDVSRIGRDLWQTTTWIENATKNGIIILTPDEQYVLPIPNFETLYNAYRQQRRTNQRKKRK